MENFLIEPFLHADNSCQHINTKDIDELLRIRPNELFQPHKTMFNIIHLFSEGKGKLTVDFNTFDIEERHILFISQHQISQFHNPVSYKSKILIFTEDFFGKNVFQTQFFGQTHLFNDPLLLPYFDLGDRYEEVVSLFNFISTELNRPYNEVQTTILNNYLFNILLIVESLCERKDIKLVVNDEKLLVSKFKSIVNANLNWQYNLDYYTEKLNVGLRTLQNAFQLTEKQTPKQWLIDRMILEIKRNLIYKEVGIGAIAYNLGFNEVTNFTKFFKSKTGLTPTQFRELSSW